MIALTFIEETKVDGWVKAMLQGLEQLDPITENIEYMYTNFLNHFQMQFTNSTKQEVAQAALNRHSFRFPHIDQYISNFETLVRKAGYTVGSQESMNYFVKGLQAAPDVAEKVIEKFPVDYQDLKDKAIIVVKARQLIRAMRNMNTFPFQRTAQQTNQPNPPRYNLLNAPKT